MEWRRRRRVQKTLYINMKNKKSTINKCDLLAMLLKKEKRKKVNRGKLLLGDQVRACEMYQARMRNGIRHVGVVL